MTQISLSDHAVVGPQLDITSPAEVVEIRIRGDGDVVWINVDGVCRLRICRIPTVVVDDERAKRKIGENNS